MATLAYIPRLDGLRAVAIIGVMLQHSTTAGFIQLFDFVQLFFVISGYLITRILLKYSDEYSLGEAAADFYWRRLVRLGPALYLAIGAACAIGIADMDQYWWVHGLYLTNIMIAVSGRWGEAGHFWSLSVEEQFYIIWLPVVCLLSRKHLLRVVLATLVAAPVCRIILATLHIDLLDAGPGVLLPLKCDGLGYGAAIALCSGQKRSFFVIEFLRSRYVMALSAVLMLITGWFLTIEWVQPIWLTAETIFCASIVNSVVENKARLLNWLEWAPLKRIGVISYGTYVYHFFVPQVWDLIVERYPTLSLPNDLAKSLALVIVSLALGKLSWHFIERPILKWRDRNV